MTKCLCKKDIESWHFNFSQEEPIFEKNNELGKKLKDLLLSIRRASGSKARLTTLLDNIEKKPELRTWFLREIKKRTHKDCFGWQCRMKVVKINKRCCYHKKGGKK